MRIACRLIPLILLTGAAVGPVRGQIRVNPTGVNVSTQGATTVFLTYGGLTGYRPVEALWCGELIPAAPALGLRCDPGTIFGALPVRYDRSGAGGIGGFTDVMTIPPSVARRAYQAAEGGAPSAFYYVRRFRSLEGGSEQFVAVTCRLSGGGARTPLSLSDVRLAFTPEETVVQVAQGDPAPALEARITYTGTGRLVGRWEVVLPGEELPTTEDLLTEASLPLERRGTQRRYTQLGRFNLFLPPTGSVVVPGPDPVRLPTQTDGVYYLLLRIEASAEKEGDSNLEAAGAGTGIVPSGGVAGFPMPVLRYLVGSGQVLSSEPAGDEHRLTLLGPSAGARLDSMTPTTFTWESIPHVALYRVEFGTEDNPRAFAALAPGGVAGYRAPPLLTDRLGQGPFRWRVVAVDGAGRELARSAWRDARFRAPEEP